MMRYNKGWAGKHGKKADRVKSGKLVEKGCSLRTGTFTGNTISLLKLKAV
ncbi:MAG: hypothetical protein SPI25_03090 [Dialister sp.]|nr:hypothetical protein [Dialister sp.]